MIIRRSDIGRIREDNKEGVFEKINKRRDITKIKLYVE
jgi:hypothetical protein